MKLTTKLQAFSNLFQPVEYTSDMSTVEIKTNPTSFYADPPQIAGVCFKNNLIHTLFANSYQLDEPLPLPTLAKFTAVSKFDMEYLEKILKLFKGEKDVILYTGINTPIKFEGNYFSVYLSPRIEESDEKRAKEILKKESANNENKKNKL